ncbi:MAG TPA: DUF2586 family protein [Flavobacteriaceae bacterium]|nr:DUF2586 family protein [Flavobacteriaceae bacterium]
MAELSGVNIARLQGGLGRTNNSTDNHIAYIVAIPVAEATVATAINNEGKGVAVTSVYQVEQLGINAAFDANNAVDLHWQITEFFRLAPEATLYLFDKITEADLKGFINANQEIKGYGLHIDFSGETPPTITSVLSAQQTIIDAFAMENRLIDFVIIGADSLSVYTQDLFALEAPQVSVLIACTKDNGVTNVGSALGMAAVRQINENLGSVNIQNKPREKRGNVSYPLTDANLGVWLTAFLTDGTEVSLMEKTALKAILDKGYIAAASYEGFAGIYFTDSCTAIERASDYGNIENNRVWNKAARAIRTALLPYVKGVVKKDPATGFIAATTAMYWQGVAENALNTMQSNDEISGYDVYINREQVVNSTSPVSVKALVVMDGIVHEFEVSLGLTNSIN